MKVKDLIQALQDVNPESIVIMARDGEGNGYSPLADIDDSMVYLADSTYSGEIGFAELTKELIEDGYTEDDVREGEPCVVLSPTN
jgi:hypothetical protein